MTELNQNEFAKSVPSLKHRRSMIEDSFLLNDLEDTFLVWLDTNIDRNDDCIETEVELRRRFNCCLKTFTDADHCVNYLRSFTSDQSRIILIVSGSLGSKLLLQVHEFHAIISSYIFCWNEVLHIDWAKNFSKVKGIFTSKTALIEKLSIDHTLYSIKKTPIHILTADKNQQSVHDLNSQTASFMWFSLILRTILSLRGNRNCQAKSDFVEICRQLYKDDKTQQKLITDFEKTTLLEEEKRFTGIRAIAFSTAR